MALYADLQAQHYLDQTYGTVSNNPYTAPGFNCDNPSLFSAEAMLLAGFTVWPGYGRFFTDSITYPGFMHRYPSNTGNISADELIGVATIGSNTDLLLRYGRKNWWIFQPQGGKFVWGSWMARFPNFIPYVKHRAVGLRWYDLHWKTLWSLGCILSPFSSGTSGPLLMWVQIQKMQGHYWLTDQAIKFWKWKMNRLYSGGLKQLMYIYFGPNHPFTQHAPTNF